LGVSEAEPAGKPQANWSKIGAEQVLVGIEEGPLHRSVPALRGGFPSGFSGRYPNARGLLLCRREELELRHVVAFQKPAEESTCGSKKRACSKA
jgi:hypothetical protein